MSLELMRIKNSLNMTKLLNLCLQVQKLSIYYITKKSQQFQVS